MSNERQQVVMAAIPQGNGLGTAGFVCSLIGILTCGLLSPLGLLFSLFAILRPPRGMAFAGLVLGALGSGFFLLFGFAIITTAMGLREVAVAVDEAHQRSNPDALSQGPLLNEGESRDDVENIQTPDERGEPDIQTEDESNPDDQETGPADNESQGEPVLEPQELRAWTSANGRFTTEARLVGYDSGKVTLEKRNGKRTIVKASQLSLGDREYLRKIIDAARQQ